MGLSTDTLNFQLPKCRHAVALKLYNPFPAKYTLWLQAGITGFVKFYFKPGFTVLMACFLQPEILVVGY